MKTPDATNNVMERLDKMQFFVGQRAGRELWMGKPKDVQEKDLESFNRDIETVRSYIQQLERDAAVDDMTTVIYNGAEIVCQFCKHRDEHKCAQICGFAFKGFEWRGVKED